MTNYGEIALTSTIYLLVFLTVIRYFNKILISLRIRRSYFYIISIILFILMIIVDLVRLTQTENISISIVETVSLTCLLSFFYKPQLRFKLLYSILIIVISTFSTVVPFYLIMLISRKNFYIFTFDNSTWYFIVCLLIVLIFFFTSTLVTKFLGNSISKVPIHLVVLLITIPTISIIGIVLLFIELKYTEKSIIYGTVIIRFVVLVCILFVNFIAFYLFDNVVKYLHQTADMNLLQKQIKLQDKFYSKLESSHTEIRKMRHDMKHRLDAINILIEENNYSEAKAELSSMITSVEMQRIVDSGNQHLDAILNLKLSEAQRAGITVQTRAFVSSGLHLTFSDLCVLLGNAFDNAIEACQQIQYGKKNIDLEISSLNQALFISISNTVNSSVGCSIEELQTNKNDTKNHGFGLRSIQYIAQKYNGAIKIETDQHIYRLIIVLQNP